MSQSLSLTEFFHTGKLDADFEVKDGYVTGLCVLYAERTAGEQEYMIREKSIVMRDGRELSACVQEAKDLACRSALSRLSNLPAAPVSSPSLSKKPSEPIGVRSPAPVAMIMETAEEKPKQAENMPVTVAPIEQEPEQEAEQEAVQKEEPAMLVEQEEEGSILRGAQQIGLADLRPASSLLTAPEQSDALDPDEEEKEFQAACAMPITILGKLHECSGWTAGKILEQRPEVIVEFANRYNGPKTGERDALRTLYTEALRRVNRAA